MKSVTGCCLDLDLDLDLDFDLDLDLDLENCLGSTRWNHIYIYIYIAFVSARVCTHICIETTHARIHISSSGLEPGIKRPRAVLVRMRFLSLSLSL